VTSAPPWIPGGPSRRRAVLWDLDGTLVDSAEMHFRAWQETLEEHGVSVTRERFLETFGQRNDAILGQWLPGGPRERIPEIGEAKEVRYRALVAAEGLEPADGAADWVRRLDERGWRQAIASSAPRLNVEVVVETLGLARYFEVRVAAEDVRTGKPEPEVFLVAARRLDTPVTRAVVVEDAPAGVEAARRAGMPSIGVGATGLDGADIVVSSLIDLPDDAFDRLVPP